MALQVFTVIPADLGCKKINDTLGIKHKVMGKARDLFGHNSKMLTRSAVPLTH